MSKYFFVLLFLVSLTYFSCTSDKQEASSTLETDTLASIEDLDSLTCRADHLTPAETQFFKKFKNEEDFFVADSVLRYERLENGEMVNFLNEIIYKRDVADLIGGIYASYTLTYTPIISADSDPFVNYSFRAGNASAGNGTIVKLGDKIILTQRGCGTSCSTIVKDNGKKICEKTE